MTTNRAILDRIGDKSVLRFERHLAHPPERVWSLVTEPVELARWFPATVSYAAEPGPGVGLRFRFEGEDTDTAGGILEYQPPKVFSFRWQDDILRFELVPDGDGCQLHFSHVISDSMGGVLAAGRNAAGWDTCLDTLEATLDARPPQPPRDIHQRIEAGTVRPGPGRGHRIRRRLPGAVPARPGVGPNVAVRHRSGSPTGTSRPARSPRSTRPMSLSTPGGTTGSRPVWCVGSSPRIRSAATA